MPERGLATIFVAKLSIIFHPAKFSAKKIAKISKGGWASLKLRAETKKAGGAVAGGGFAAVFRI